VKSLIEKISEAESSKTAIGHFNISDLSALKGIFEAAKGLSLPVIIGLSDGERNFIGAKQAAALVKSLREEYNYPIFINADHAKTLEGIKEAAEAGFDAVMLDAGDLPLEENIVKTKEAVICAKGINKNILVEGEMGYIGGHSQIIGKEEAIIKEENLVRPEEAVGFIKETGIDFLAPSVGNIHGMFKDAPLPNLDISRIKEIKELIDIPLVLHGGSGIKDEEILSAISAGIRIIHINTEIRLAWRNALKKSFEENPEEIAPYKIFPSAVEAVRKIVDLKLKLFGGVEIIR
jgi:fructose-bisphosphate aldolase class II